VGSPQRAASTLTASDVRSWPAEATASARVHPADEGEDTHRVAWGWIHGTHDDSDVHQVGAGRRPRVQVSSPTRTGGRWVDVARG
jgi:hypothetical protein